MTLCSRGSRRRAAARSFKPHSGISRIATSPDEPDRAEEADVTDERHGDAEPHERRVASVHNEQSAEIRPKRTPIQAEANEPKDGRSILAPVSGKRSNDRIDRLVGGDRRGFAAR